MLFRSTANRLVRNMVELAAVPLCEAVRMMTLTPARLLGLSGTKGVIAPGIDADLVVFDEDLEIALTMVEGRVVHSRLRETGAG